MPSTLTCRVLEQTFILHPYRAIYWSDQDMLLVADLHLGKIQHFRNAGIFVPERASLDNYERLSSILLDFNPSKVVILGDLFHSTYNRDWQNFSDLRQTFHHIEFHLITGNHDILEQQLFEHNEVHVHSDGLQQQPFLLSHKPLLGIDAYNLAGHLHPGILFRSPGLPSERLPAFHFGSKGGLLPSFGTFTGHSIVYPRPGDQVVVILGEDLIRIDS